MFFSSAGEFTVILLFLAIYFLARRLKISWPQKYWLLLGNLLLILTLTNLFTIAVQVALSVMVFLVGSRLHKIQNHRYKKSAVTAAIVILIGLFFYRNYSAGQDALTARLGISYILFRHIQYLVDSFKSRIQNFNGLDYVNFILFFPNFLAGPIDTYNNFSRWHNKPWGKLQKALVLPGVSRIFIGAVKKYALVPLILTEATDYQVLSQHHGIYIGLALSLVAYSAYIFLDFSGYSDIAIGTGYLMGIKIPENFRSPYLSTNLADFWRRWHITFSNFLRNLIFKPLVIQLSSWFPRSPRLFISSIGYIITFVICGVWHGNTLNFVYWGLWHGVGLVILKLWDTYKYNWLGNRVPTKMGYQLFMVVFTFGFVTLGWVFFHYSNNQLIEIFNKLW